MADGLIEALREAAGGTAVVTDTAVLAGHEVDWTGRFHGRARALVRPSDADAVAAVLRTCGAHRVGVVPQGGNTGLVGGAVPHDTVVLSTARLDRLGVVDRRAAEVTAGAGVTLERLQAHAAAAGLAFGLDVASRASATVGGLIATDAGGIHGLRYGSMGRQVLELEVIFADGTVVEGPLGGLFAASEGTLGVITRARLRLIPVWRHRATALLAFGDVGAAVEATVLLRAALPDLEAVELLDAASIRLSAERAGQRVPFDGGGPAVLVESASNRPMLEELAGTVATLPGIRDAALADDPPGRRRLWALREGVTEAIAGLGIPHKLDVGVPLGELARFVERLARLCGDADRLFVFGHLALGNLHVNVVGPAADDERLDDAILELVLEHGGSVAAEHGFGRAKTRWLRRARSPGELALQGAVKRALDPAGILNPGVLDGDAR